MPGAAAGMPKEEVPTRAPKVVRRMSEVTEHGDIYFLYRPRVEHEEVEDPEEVQRLYVALLFAGEWE